ncbi:MAG: hypothetical protein ING31_12335 [Burkholderiales bacterium]|nr:hypothetical protein [Burkholderiales bacterium]
MINHHVNFFHLPTILAEDGFAVGRIAVSSEGLNNKFITLRSTEVEGGANLFGIIDRCDADEAVANLNLGASLQFQIVSEQGILANLPVPNDTTFSECYNVLRQRIQSKR